MPISSLARVMVCLSAVHALHAISDLRHDSSATSLMHVNRIHHSRELEKLVVLQEHHSSTTEDNLYGSAQAACGDSTCGVDPPAIHAICVALPANFCQETGQSDWCTAEASKPHCVCLGAWSLYVSKGDDAAPDVTCDAVPGSIFTDDYIGSWSTWNGNELEGQEARGLQALFDKCNTGSSAAAFKSTFCTFVKGSKKLSAAQVTSLSSHAQCS